MKHTGWIASEQTTVDLSQELQSRLMIFLRPLLLALDEQLDKRLVRTFVRTMAAILTFRHGRCGLLLSELGGYILSPAQAPAGTKRLSNLLRSPKWDYTLIEQFLWQRGEARVRELKQAGEEALVLWDESVLEKAGSLALEGLCAVRSSTAEWRKRIKPGFYNPPGRPIFVPGMNWVGLLVIGLRGAPEVAAMRWWSTRGKGASDKRREEEKLLVACAQRWGRQVLHVWDRGFAGSPWLSVALAHSARFVVRWQKHYMLFGCSRQQAQSLDHLSRQTLLGPSVHLGCAPPLPAQNRHLCHAGFSSRLPQCAAVAGRFTSRQGTCALVLVDQPAGYYTAASLALHPFLCPPLANRDGLALQ